MELSLHFCFVHRAELMLCITEHADMVELLPGSHVVNVSENPNNPFLAENWDGVCTNTAVCPHYTVV